MSLPIILATYLVTWWVVLFAILPWGIRTQHEAEEAIVPGTAPSAPIRPLLLWKMAITTAVAALIVAAIYWLVAHSGLTIDTIPILSDLGRA